MSPLAMLANKRKFDSTVNGITPEDNLTDSEVYTETQARCDCMNAEQYTNSEQDLNNEGPRKKHCTEGKNSEVKQSSFEERPTLRVTGEQLQQNRYINGPENDSMSVGGLSQNGYHMPRQYQPPHPEDDYAPVKDSSNGTVMHRNKHYMLLKRPIMVPEDEEEMHMECRLQRRNDKKKQKATVEHDSLIHQDRASSKPTPSEIDIALLDEEAWEQEGAKNWYECYESDEDYYDSEMEFEEKHCDPELASDMEFEAYCYRELAADDDKPDERKLVWIPTRAEADQAMEEYRASSIKRYNEWIAKNREG